MLGNREDVFRKGKAAQFDNSEWKLFSSFGNVTSDRSSLEKQGGRLCVPGRKRERRRPARRKERTVVGREK